MNLQYAYRNYPHPQTSTGGFRHDSELLVSASWVKPLRDDFYFIAEYALDLNESNIEANSYDRNVVDLGVQWNFGGRN